ncbi:DUF2628 domain-containing protein [Pelistega sp. NLN82]|uniref:DUF2628 domain-containing protein n=1 Tax=Pelistega ratti TaxID=2652177 RepID=A0A6L9Y5N7_9BURK|nr:DUF2628 domain-containing protein [Pelistega ratti]NEN75535.1 DUF2628 domain-containing protein [Pelistega ratti]
MSELNHSNYADLNPKWQKRFAFFDKYGTKESAPEYKEAYKALSFKDRRIQGMNFYAFFFGLIYFFILGLWRKNLALIGLFVGLFLVLDFGVDMLSINIPEKTIDRIFNLVIMWTYGSIANKAYYLHKVKGSKSWNPFES